MWVWCRDYCMGFFVHCSVEDNIKRADSFPRCQQSSVSWVLQSESRKQGNAAGEHRVSAGGEPQNQKRSKFLGMLLTAARLPSKCTESLCKLYIDVYCKIGTEKYPGLFKNEKYRFNCPVLDERSLLPTAVYLGILLGSQAGKSLFYAPKQRAVLRGNSITNS